MDIKRDSFDFMQKMQVGSSPVNVGVYTSYPADFSKDDRKRQHHPPCPSHVGRSKRHNHDILQ